MKTFKTVLFFVILIFLGITVFVNNEYFLSKYSMLIGIKIPSWQWALPEIMNIAYFGICFLLGLLLAGYFWISSSFKLRKTIRLLKKETNSYHEQVISLKTELDRFHSDPYIKNEPEKSEEKFPVQVQST